MTQRWRERWGGGRSPSGAILQRGEGMQSSTVISLHLQPAPSRILIAHIPQLQCLPNPHNGLQHSLHATSSRPRWAPLSDSELHINTPLRVIAVIIIVSVVVTQCCARKYWLQASRRVKANCSHLQNQDTRRALRRFVFICSHMSYNSHWKRGHWL